MNARKTQHPRNNLILHLAPTAHEKQNKQYGDRFVHARRSDRSMTVTMFFLIFSLM